VKRELVKGEEGRVDLGEMGSDMRKREDG